MNIADFVRAKKLLDSTFTENPKIVQWIEEDGCMVGIDSEGLPRTITSTEEFFKRLVSESE